MCKFRLYIAVFYFIVFFQLPTIWSTGNRNSKEDIDSISVETDNDSNRQASTIEAQRRKLKERTILAIIIGFVLIIAILVPLIVIIVLPKGGKAYSIINFLKWREVNDVYTFIIFMLNCAIDACLRRLWYM